MANVLSMASFKGPAVLTPAGKCLPSKDARWDHYTVRDRLKIGLIDEASLVTISRTDPQTKGPWLQPSQRGQSKQVKTACPFSSAKMATWPKTQTAKGHYDNQDESDYQNRRRLLPGRPGVMISKTSNINSAPFQ
ncbi:hypothetical protein ED733_007837 [Metarhizium rileyi]|uniref:Uncharacterized protein n=1 Tax=Metarhizium rileyi (strain RCEF 4871) TaxID=1649241 RepID=A0A5C6GJE3_METRR|nr:hypothetical protein ED733_007837 [Metarhizium rileyi]